MAVFVFVLVAFQNCIEYAMVRVGLEPNVDEICDHEEDGSDSRELCDFVVKFIRCCETRAVHCNEESRRDR